MSVRSERARKAAELEVRDEIRAANVLRQDDCADGLHRYGKESPVFKGQRACRCGAVEGELPN